MAPSELLRYAAAAVLWLIVIGRFLSALRQGASPDPIVRRQVWFFWGIYLCLSLAATAYLPVVEQRLAEAGAGWVGPLPRTTLAIACFLLGVYIAYDFAPQLRPRWNWPLVLGLLTQGALTLLAWAAGTARLALPGPAAGASQDALFNFYILLLVVRVALPAFDWAWRHEGQRAMRLRFRLMQLTSLSIAAWMLVGLAEGLARVLGAAFDPAALFSALLVVCTISFILAYLMPAHVFVSLVRAWDHGRDFANWLAVRSLEIRVAELAGRRLTAVSGREVLRTPGLALYRSVIAVFDARKMLKARPALPAQILAAQIELAAQPQLAYPDVVRELAGQGRDQARKRLRRRLELPARADPRQGDV